jgi:transcriptional regulator with XRE-family HTH domain
VAMLMSIHELHNPSSAYPYLRGMGPKRLSVRAIIATNLKALMQKRDWTQIELGKNAGVSQRHVSNILNQETDCTSEVLNALAGAFDLPGWLLSIPNLPVELLDSNAIPQLVRRYIDAGSQGRQLLDVMAEREATHNLDRQKVVSITKSKTG